MTEEEAVAARARLAAYSKPLKPRVGSLSTVSVSVYTAADHDRDLLHRVLRHAPTPLQLDIMAELRKGPRTTIQLAEMFSKGHRSNLYYTHPLKKSGGLRELQRKGLVRYQRGHGQVRTDLEQMPSLTSTLVSGRAKPASCRRSRRRHPNERNLPATLTCTSSSSVSESISIAAGISTSTSTYALTDRELDWRLLYAVLPYPPTEVQLTIMAELREGPRKKVELAQACTKRDESRLYYANRKTKSGGLRDLVQSGLVRNETGLGYARTDLSRD